jgi:hypothetical protein
MVYSQTKKTASIASITNQKQGGGSKKAGLPYQVGREAWSSVAIDNKSLKVLTMPMTSNVSISRNIGMRFSMR